MPATYPNRRRRGATPVLSNLRNSAPAGTEEILQIEVSAVRSVTIDSFLWQVREAEIDNSLEEFQNIVGGFIEFGVSINNRDMMYVADFAHWSQRFVIGNRHVFSGCGLVIGADGKGRACSARVPLREIRKIVRFLPPKPADEPAVPPPQAGV